MLVGQYPITRRQAVAARLSPVVCWTVPRLVRAQHERERTPGTPTLQGRFVCGICDRKMQAHWANNLACYRCRFPNEYALANKISHPRNVYVRETDVLPGLDAWLAEEFAPTASPRPSTTSPPPSACSLMSLARNWGLPIRHHSQFSGIGHLDLPAPPSPAMRAVTSAPEHWAGWNWSPASPATTASPQQPASFMMAAPAPWYRCSTRSRRPPDSPSSTGPAGRWAPTAAGREFIQEASQILRIAQEQEDRPDGQLADGPSREEQSRLDPGAPLANWRPGRGRRLCELHLQAGER